MGDAEKKEDFGDEIPQNGPTKGEQCMLVLILSTLLMILIFLIVFAIHLALVKHTVSDIFRGWTYDDDYQEKSYGGNESDIGIYNYNELPEDAIKGNKFPEDQIKGNKFPEDPIKINKLPEYPIEVSSETAGNITATTTSGCDGKTKFGIKNAIIGIVYLNISSPRMLCNALKIKDQWSLVPGYCSALWSDRHLTTYTSAWLTRYYIGQGFIAMTVGSRSLPIENSQRHLKTEILFMNSVNDKSPLTMEVKRMTFKNCLSAIFAVATPRSYEICYEFALNSGSCVENGGFLQEDSRTTGLFSWMNRCPDMELPFVVISLNSFSKWIADTTAISLTDLETSSV